LVDVAEDANGITACFADGSTADADILIGADGSAPPSARSSIRRHRSRIMPA
jgi:2-polyprenyl-6-methoxyphenol hydroxylase-like FAD-dependent oxidoreductase